MKIEYIASAVGMAAPHQFLTSFVIDDRVAIDAGAIGVVSPPSRQKRIRHVFLSHSHIDHVATLPLFLDNVYDPHGDCVRVYASPAVQDCLRRDVFNDRLWPDLTLMSDPTPFVQFETLHDDQPIQIDDLQITPITVDHVVPCFAFLIEGSDAAAAIVTDTGPTHAVWERIQAAENLGAVFLEASFPSSLQWLADKSKHLTPAQFLVEIAKLDRVVPVYAIHLKPVFHDQMVSELMSLGLKNLEIAEPGREYEINGCA